MTEKNKKIVLVLLLTILVVTVTIFGMGFVFAMDTLWQAHPNWITFFFVGILIFILCIKWYLNFQKKNCKNK